MIRNAYQYERHTFFQGASRLCSITTQARRLRLGITLSSDSPHWSWLGRVFKHVTTRSDPTSSRGVGNNLIGEWPPRSVTSRRDRGVMSACGLLGYMQTLLDDLILEARASPRPSQIYYFARQQSICWYCDVTPRHLILTFKLVCSHTILVYSLHFHTFKLSILLLPHAKNAQYDLDQWYFEL